MAITLRGNKGTPLTHDELDNNFKSFYYSASYIGETERPYGLSLYQTSSLDQPSTFYFPTAVGDDYHIQIKSGSTNVSSSFLTGSSNFKYNYDTNHLSVSGSGQMSGNLVVLGTVTAQEFVSELVSSSILYESGSTKFGDTSDDTHQFTGSIELNGDFVGNNQLFALGITGSIEATNGVVSGSIQIASDISGSSTALSASIATDIAADKAALAIASSSLASRVTTNSSSIATNDIEIASLTAATSSYLQNTTDTLTGDLTITGTLTANTYVVSSSVTYLTQSFSSGSTRFGDSSDDTHIFTGSVNISGSTTLQTLSADVINATTINATVSGSIDQATTASNAATASTVNFNGGLTTTSDVQFDSLGVGTAASGTTGEIRATGDITAYYSSDERLKDNITPLSDAINKINQIGGYEFDWNSNSSHSGHDVGVIAQEIEKVLPEVVTERDNGYLAVRYEKIVALLIQAVKEQQLQIDELKAKL